MLESRVLRQGPSLPPGRPVAASRTPQSLSLPFPTEQAPGSEGAQPLGAVAPSIKALHPAPSFVPDGEEPAAGDTSLDLYRLKESKRESFARNISGAVAALSPEIQAKICTDPWAVRHRLVHVESGLALPMHCDRYNCLSCGPRRVAMWRDLVQLAEPERFITLSKMGETLGDASKALKVVVKHLRRLGYRVEYFATFERHKNGWFHAHMLHKGDYIPQRVLSECLRSATHGASFVCDIRRADKHIAGYVTKYVTKQLTADEVGRGDDGRPRRFRRVRNSRQFFPAPTKVMREYLRAQLAEKRAEKGEEVFELEGSWQLVEFAELPRLSNGRVDQAAAARQYERLVSSRLEEAATDARMVRGGLVVLSYMLRENAGKEGTSNEAVAS